MDWVQWCFLVYCPRKRDHCIKLIDESKSKKMITTCTSSWSYHFLMGF